MAAARILALAGSARQGSYNRMLVQVAAEGARSAGADVTILELSEFPLPIFNEDLEAEGTPENSTRLKELFLAHDGLLIASPEYNSSVSPLLKNLIDWVSRPRKGEPRLAAYRNKIAALMAASPGRLGGLRGLTHLRSVLSSIGVTVLPDQTAVPAAHEAFDDDGRLRDPDRQQEVESLGATLASIVQRLSAP